MNPPNEVPSKLPMRTRALLPALALILAFSFVLANAASAVSTGSRAPEIGLSDFNGQPVRLRSLRGKVVIVDFWASWCAPCREELPVLNRLQERYREQGLVVIGVNVDNELRNARTFLRRTHVDFRVVHDPEKEVADRYNPPRMPSSYVVDRRGVIRHVHEGFRSGDAAVLEREVRDLLRAR
jgi:cytochrome c biogenesis protein CcmG, thiol:disulfide interchange protein DsbE